MSEDINDNVDVDEILDDEDVSIDGYKIDGEFSDDNVRGIDQDTYIHNISSENLTPEERALTLSRPCQRIYSSVAGLDFTFPYDAAPRLQMFCSHNTQRLVFDGMTPKNIINGVEQEFGKFNFKIEVQENCIIHEVIKVLLQPRIGES